MYKLNKRNMVLSIIIPVYNERKTILEVLKAVEAVDLGNIEKEIIIIDDYSADGTRDILKNFENKYKIFYQDKNYGKGAAIRRGFKISSGDICLIQDADLELDPREYPKLLEPIKEGLADVVYGSRFAGGERRKVLNLWHLMGNRFLTAFSNIFTGLTLSDMETCYKVFTRRSVEKILPTLKSDRFGFEPEVTAKVARNKFRVYEVAISYDSRTYEEGKKINWWDGIKAIFCIVYFSFFD